MKVRDIVFENASAGATASGSIAPMAQPMGEVIKRNAAPAKYANSVDSKKKNAKRKS